MTTSVHISWRYIIKRFEHAFIVVVTDELTQFPFKFFWLIVVHQLDHILHRSMITLDLALGRKNWMFCRTELGAQYVGIIQSLLST